MKESECGCFYFHLLKTMSCKYFDFFSELRPQCWGCKGPERNVHCTEGSQGGSRGGSQQEVRGAQATLYTGRGKNETVCPRGLPVLGAFLQHHLCVPRAFITVSLVCPLRDSLLLPIGSCRQKIYFWLTIMEFALKFESTHKKNEKQLKHEIVTIGVGDVCFEMIFGGRSLMVNKQ